MLMRHVMIAVLLLVSFGSVQGQTPAVPGVTSAATSAESPEIRELQKVEDS